MQSKAKAPADYRLVAHLRAKPTSPPHEISPRSYAGDLVQIDNEALISGQHGVTVDAATGARLNAFFAIPVNNPSTGVVNLSCRVSAARKPRAPGVIQSVAPPPTRTAVRMEVGADARL
jgi:hypothetical protein